MLTGEPNLEMTEDLPIDPYCKKAFELGGHDYRSVGAGNPEEPICC
jgi:hypothetical protein